MHSFARTIDLGRPVPHLAHRRGVVKAAELGMVEQASAIIRSAESDAAKILGDARKQADALLEQQRQEADRLRNEVLRSAEETFWKQAAAHQQALDKQFQEFAAALEDQALPVVRKAIATLAHEMPPEARVAACVRTLIAEVGLQTDAALVVNEQDSGALNALQPALAWPVRIDNNIAPGTCRLVAQRGEWSSTFDGRLERLLAAFELSCVDEGSEPEEQLAA